MMESGAILFTLRRKSANFCPKTHASATTPCSGCSSRWRTSVRCSGRRTLQQLCEGKPADAKDRYNNESLRLFRCLTTVSRMPWIGCDEYTIADIATYPWTKGFKDRGRRRKKLRKFRALDQSDGSTACCAAQTSLPQRSASA